MNNTEYLKEEFKKAVLDVRPDAVINDSWRDGVSVAKPNASYERYIAWLDIDEEEEGMYQVWNGLDWDKYHTLEQFKSNFIGHYGCTTKPKDKEEPVKGKHYDGIVETIKLIEEVVAREALPRTSAYCIGNALKYIMRCSVKPGTDWKDDIKKARNYLNRALTGEWID